MKNWPLRVSLSKISCCYSNCSAAFSAITVSTAFLLCFGRTCQMSHQKIDGCFPPWSTSCPGPRTDSNFSRRSMQLHRMRLPRSATGATAYSSASPASSHRRHCLEQRLPSSTYSNSSNSTTDAAAAIAALSNSNRHSYSPRWPRL